MTLYVLLYSIQTQLKNETCGSKIFNFSLINISSITFNVNKKKFNKFNVVYLFQATRI